MHRCMLGWSFIAVLSMAITGSSQAQALPDLTVTTVSGPGVAGVAQTVPVTNVLVNTGAAASNWSYRVYLSSDATITTNDVVLLLQGPFTAFPAASALTNVVTVTLPLSTVPGSYYVGVIIDSDNVIVESNDANNALASGPVSLLGPDLSVLSVSGPGLAGLGQAVTLTNRFANTAIGAAVNYGYRIYLSQDAAITTNDTLVATKSSLGSFPAQTTVTNLDPVLIPPASPTGTVYFGVIVNYEGSVTESNTANNSGSSAPLTLFGPDLTVVSVAGPASAGTAQTVVLTNVLANIGLGVAGAYGYRLYLSPDAIITTNDLLLANKGLFTGLGAQTTLTNLDVVAIPGTVSTGLYYFGAIIDYNNLVQESIETNNALASSAVGVSIGPDLAVMSVGGPSVAGTGQTLTLTNVLANVGVGAAGGFAYRIYLATNATVSTNNTLLVPKDIVGLPAQSIATNLDVVLIPSATPTGTYYFGVIIDPNGALAEASKTNNTLVSGPVAVGIGPDLTVLSVTGPPLAGPSLTVTIRSCMANIGLGAAGAWSYRIYLVTNTADATNGTILATKSGALSFAAGTTLTNVDQVVIPAGTASGPYAFGLMVDPNNTVTEASEVNNTLSSAPVALGPLFTGIRPQTNSAVLDVAGLIAAELYSVEYSPSLSDTNDWATGVTFSAAGPVTNYVDGTATGTVFRAYRIEHH